jgi:hypothetical protein
MVRRAHNLRKQSGPEETGSMTDRLDSVNELRSFGRGILYRDSGGVLRYADAERSLKVIDGGNAPPEADLAMTTHSSPESGRGRPAAPSPARNEIRNNAGVRCLGHCRGQNGRGSL